MNTQKATEIIEAAMVVVRSMQYHDVQDPSFYDLWYYYIDTLGEYVNFNYIIGLLKNVVKYTNTGKCIYWHIGTSPDPIVNGNKAFQVLNLEIIQKVYNRAKRDVSHLTSENLFKLVFVLARSRNYHFSQGIGPLLYESSKNM